MKISYIPIWTSGSAPTGKRMNVKVHVFQLGYFPRSKIESDSIFLIKYYIITILKKIRAFWPIFNKVKKWIFPCIFKACAEGFQVFFQARELILFAKWLVFTY